jgi:Xaa-Pro aminopeptidase
MKAVIDKKEFQERITRTQALMQKERIHLLFAYGNETEPQYIRYYSNYWPNFEVAGVLIPATGEPTLIIGPESETFARSVSKISRIRRILAFRESSEPEYPDAKLCTMTEAIQEAMGGQNPETIGIVGTCLLSHVVYLALEEAVRNLGNPKLLKADLLVSKLRAVKSPAEIACMREAYRITQCAMKRVIAEIRLGMTEEQVRGIAVSTMYQEGAEGEAYPCWILTGEGSNLAIGRCRGKVIQPQDMVQIQIGARYEGYASTMGRAVVMGRANPVQRSLIEASLAGQRAILDTARAGVNAKEVYDAYYQAVKSFGQEHHILYGPVHGTGLMEGEYPWIESNSDYPLEEGMTFCTCVYLGDNEHRQGIRFEDGFLVTAEGTEAFSDYGRMLIERIADS